MVIGHLQGEVLVATSESLTVLCGSVGYEVRVTRALAQQNPAGSTVHLWTHLSVRDTGWDLFGFESRQERDLFRVLQKVPQVGAKTAQAMLEVFSVPVLIRLVSERDAEALTTVPGIGKKSAARIIVELQDMFAAMADGIPEPGAAESPRSWEAVQALIGLGFSVTDAQKRVSDAIDTGADPGDIEGLIRQVLVMDGS